MTQEHMQDLRRYVLAGIEKPWHYVEGDEDSEANYYPDGVPVEKVVELLDLIGAYKSPVMTFDLDGNGKIDESTEAVKLGPNAPQPNKAVYYGAPGFSIHDMVDDILPLIMPYLDKGILIRAAGLIRGGAGAWVQLTRPGVETVAGFNYRPGLLASTSLDGKTKTRVDDTSVASICDNTFTWALKASRASVQIKHTRYSRDRLHGDEMRNRIDEIAEGMGYQIQKAVDTRVSDAQFEAFLAELFPVPTLDKAGRRARTVAQNKQNAIRELYRDDERAAQWQGTALGVMQATNTWFQHEAPIRGAERIERQAENALNGKLAEFDHKCIETLNKVLVAA